MAVGVRVLSVRRVGEGSGDVKSGGRPPVMKISLGSAVAVLIFYGLLILMVLEKGFIKWAYT